MDQEPVGVQAYVVATRVEVKKNKAGVVVRVAAKAKVVAKVAAKVGVVVRGDLDNKYNHCKKGR